MRAAIQEFFWIFCLDDFAKSSPVFIMINCPSDGFDSDSIAQQISEYPWCNGSESEHRPIENALKEPFSILWLAGHRWLIHRCTAPDKVWCGVWENLDFPRMDNSRLTDRRVSSKWVSEWVAGRMPIMPSSAMKTITSLPRNIIDRIID